MMALGMLFCVFLLLSRVETTRGTLGLARSVARGGELPQNSQIGRGAVVEAGDALPDVDKGDEIKTLGDSGESNE